MKSSAVYIVSAAHADWKFRRILKDIPAAQLGAMAIREALSRIHIDHSAVNDVIMGCVLQANLGQAPASKQQNMGFARLCK